MILYEKHFLSALFDKVPTYEDLKSRTQKTPLFTVVNSVFALARAEKSHLVKQMHLNWNTLFSNIEVINRKLEPLGVAEIAGYYENIENI